MNVVFSHKNGRQEQMAKRYAEILQKLGRGTYSEIANKKTQIEDVNDIEHLRAEADRLGIEYHHRTGLAKLRELLGR